MELRGLVKGMLKEDHEQSGLAGITVQTSPQKKTPLLDCRLTDYARQIEHGEIKVTNGNWRTDEFVKMLNVFVKELPDMQIAMNTLDQPRVIVEWEVLQEHLDIEEKGRNMDKPVTNGFSRNRELSRLNILYSYIYYIANQSR